MTKTVNAGHFFIEGIKGFGNIFISEPKKPQVGLQNCIDNLSRFAILATRLTKLPIVNTNNYCK